ncbi:hypothetical protein CKO35_05230 [Ectothiorhodospira shaposhnikovii]|uniref:hypothetical protein n=1 Tax=Ectothiorhodospira shaposhnikovii TaxID=1054 RepID=UPI00190522FA|nr:hypothetical protein [Ectothiorhodospira shaposhnikovii]MBK1672711.1 hypothetical protein [Ectothiorhodospira shaposhnikovii]
MKYGAILAAALMLSACGGGGGGGGFSGDGPGDGTQSPASIQIFADKVQVNADGSDSAEITVQVKNAGNLLLGGVPVTMTVDPDGSRPGNQGYNLVVRGAVTAETGTVTASLGSSQSLLAGNAVVTARIPDTNLSTSIGFVFVGPSLTTNPGQLQMVQGERELITVRATAGAGNPGSNQTVCIDAPSFTRVVQEAGIISRPDCPTAITTGSNGEASFRLDAQALGNGVVRLTGLGLTSDIPVTVVPAGVSFTTPSPDDAIEISTPVNIAVQTPGYAGNVRIITSSGILNGGTRIAVVPATGGVATATLTGFSTGRVTLSAEKMDASGERAITSFFAFNDSNLDPDLTNVSIQASPATLAVGSGSSSTITLTATRSQPGQSNNIPVPPGELITFEFIGDSLGSSLSSPFANTNNDGIASVRLQAGNIPSSAQGVRVRACVVSINKCDETSVTLTNRPGSLAIGLSNTIDSTNNDTAYILPISIIATDVNGGALGGVDISLRAWPTRFRTGFRDTEGDLTVGVDTHVNEDTNRNVTRDLGDGWTSGLVAGLAFGLSDTRRKCEPAGASEPAAGTVIDATAAFEQGCRLLPESSAAGSLPGVVTTDENGLATFNLTYPKDRAQVIEVEILATTQVDGTEVLSSRIFFLPREESDDNLPHSPYNIYF